MIPYTTIPFVSAFFLVLVGVLVGQLVGYRFRDEHERRARLLFGKNRELRQLLQQQGATCESLTREHQDAQQALAEARSSAAEWERLARQHQREREDAGRMCDQERQARRDLAACLADETTRREQLDQEARETQQRLADQARVQAELEAICEELRQALAQAQADATSRGEQLRQAVGQVAEFKGTCREQEQVIEQRERRVALLEQRKQELQQEQVVCQSQLSEMRERLGAAKRGVEQQTTQLADLQAQLRQEREAHARFREEHDLLVVEHHKLALDGEAARVRADQAHRESRLLRERLGHLEASHDELQAELDAARGHATQLATAAVAARDELQHEHARIVALETQRDQLQQQQHSLRSESDLQRRELQELAERLEAAEAMRHAYQLEQAEWRQTRLELDAAQESHRLLDSQLATWRRRAAELEREQEAVARRQNAVQIEYDQLLERLTVANLENEQLTVRLQQVHATYDEAREELEKHIAMLKSMTDEREQLQVRCDEAEAAIQAESHAHAETRQQIGSLQLTLAASKEKIAALRRDLERLEHVEDQLVEMEAAFNEVRAELKSLGSQRDKAAESEAAIRQIVVELREELNEQLDAIQIVRREKDAAVSQLEFEQRQRQQVQSALGQAEQRISLLAQEAESMAERHRKLVAQNADLSEQLNDSKVAARDFEQRCHHSERQLVELREQLDAQQQLARKLRRRRFASIESESLAEGKSAFSFRDMRLKELTLREEEEAKLSRHPELGSLYDQPPRRRDDLKKIPGIAERQEEQLNRMGVYTFRQIMEWSEATTKAFARQLASDDTASINEWAGHARQLYHQDDRSAA